MIEAVEGEVVANLDAFKARYEALRKQEGPGILLQVRHYENLNYVLVQAASHAPPEVEGDQE